ncbi:hypothetical protein GJ496_004085 [Pomphorhynchus laevis]|nr:hypothetical protein GJ496_004085 [Pomphorhynchus laevis]
MTALFTSITHENGILAIREKFEKSQYSDIDVDRYSSLLEMCDEVPSLWVRNVDDVLRVWDGSIDALNHFIAGLNSESEPQFSTTEEPHAREVTFMDVHL